jgi:hypothetical protein
LAEVAAAGDELEAPAGEVEFEEDPAWDVEEPQPAARRASAPSPTEPTRIFFLTLPLNMTEFLDI